MRGKRKLFSVTKKDLVIETFRAGGKGGQNQNKRDTGVRVKHPPSGAVGESREERSQLQNKRTAFTRMANTPEFQAWARLEAARVEGGLADIDQIVGELMRPHNLRIEGVDEEGKWTEIE